MQQPPLPPAPAVEKKRQGMDLDRRRGDRRCGVSQSRHRF